MAEQPSHAPQAHQQYPLSVDSRVKNANTKAKRDSVQEYNDIDLATYPGGDEEALRDQHMETFGNPLTSDESSKFSHNGTALPELTISHSNQEQQPMVPGTPFTSNNANNTPAYNGSEAAATSSGDWRSRNIPPLDISHSDTPLQANTHGTEPQHYRTDSTVNQTQSPVTVGPGTTSLTVLDKPAPRMSVLQALAAGTGASEDNVSPTTEVGPVGPATSTNNAASLMPPPAAPASMLVNLRPSKQAKPQSEWINDPAIIARLVSPTVTLFRQGKAEKARLLGQFTLDCIGQEAWNESLADFMGAPPTDDDVNWVDYLLKEAVILLRPQRPEECGFLDGMLHVLG